MTKDTKQTPPPEPRGDGHTDAGTDLYFIGVDDVFSDRNTFNLRDPRQVQERLRRRAARRSES